MIAPFALRLICGMSWMWLAMPRREVTCGFFRIQMLVVLGLSVLAALTGDFSSGQAAASAGWFRTATLVLTLLLSIANIVALPILGYSLAMFLYVSSLLVFVSKRKVVWSLPGTFIGVYASQYLFDTLGVALPRGNSPFEIDFLKLLDFLKPLVG